MSNNDTVGMFSSNTAHASLSEEKAQRLGAGQFWNIIHLLNELDYLHIQEQQVLKPLDEAFIIKSLQWYYLKRGASSGVILSWFFMIIHLLHIALVLIIGAPLSNALLYIAAAWYVYYLASFLEKMVKYHNGAATKAVTIVFEAGIGGLVLAGIMMSSTLLMIIIYRPEILEFFINWNYDYAVNVDWVFYYILGPAYVEACFLISVLIGGAAAFTKFRLKKEDLQEDRKRGRPYDRLSVSA